MKAESGFIWSDVATDLCDRQPSVQSIAFGHMRARHRPDRLPRRIEADGCAQASARDREGRPLGSCPRVHVAVASRLTRPSIRIQSTLQIRPRIKKGQARLSSEDWQTMFQYFL